MRSFLDLSTAKVLRTCWHLLALTAPSARGFHSSATLLSPKMSSPSVSTIKTRLRSKTIHVASPVTTLSGTKDDTLATPVPPLKRRKRMVTPEMASSATPIINDDNFQDLKAPPSELRPSATLTTGQCFHWRVVEQDEIKDIPSSAWGTHNATEWVGTLRTPEGESVVVCIRETSDTTLYRVVKAPGSLDIQSFLRDYFQLDHPLEALYRAWSVQDNRLGRIAKCIPGVRIINQDPWECLVSFICSSNNNIPRITKMLTAIRREYGQPVVREGEHEDIRETLYSFPSLQELKEKADEQDLRDKCGMGYRAKYIMETMEILDSLGGEAYLQELKQKSSDGAVSPLEVQEALIQFCGVGRKVADCVALFSLKQSGAIPVDVHVWNIACRDYDPEGDLRKVKSLTPTVYRQVGGLFRTRFPDNPGWAHSLLFVAELPSFRAVLPADMIEEMDNFRAEEQARKKSQKTTKNK